MASLSVLVGVIGVVAPAEAGSPPSYCVDGVDYVTTVDGDSTYVAFTMSAAGCTFTPPSTLVDYLVVGGGGGGGRTHSGGGGAGGMVTDCVELEVGSTMWITLGSGGIGNTSGVSRRGGYAGDSVLGLVSAASGAQTITGAGGGGGTSGGDTPGNGGSGGGGLDTIGTGLPGQGHNGSIGRIAAPYGGSSVAYWSGGGGGAGTAGTQGTSTGGDGGAGRAWLPGVFTATVAAALGIDPSLVSGTDVYFAGGGGGGGTSGYFVALKLEGGLGGVGGGGHGGAGAGASLSEAEVTGGDGVPGSGGGGGGGGLIDSGGVGSGFSAGGNGGSGIVILRFRSSGTCPSDVHLSLTLDETFPELTALPTTL